MTIRELLSLDCKRSSVEEFFALLYNQKVHPAFLVFSNFSISFRALEGMSVYLIEVEENNYFKLCYNNVPFLLYRFNKDNDCDFCWCVDFELYKKSLEACCKAVDKKYIPVKDIDERIF
jgi:hypothetical protein